MTKKLLYLIPMALLGAALFVDKKIKVKMRTKKIIKKRAIERWLDDGGSPYSSPSL